MGGYVGHRFPHNFSLVPAAPRETKLVGLIHRNFTETHRQAMGYQLEKQVAIASVKRASVLCQRVRNSQASQPLSKADATPVTIADFGAQAVICHDLIQTFGQDPVIGEEDASMLQDQPTVLAKITAQVCQELPTATLPQVVSWINHGNGVLADRYWTIDPIDGTKGFVRGGQYAIALALVERGEVVLGVMGCPALPDHEGNPGCLYVAVKNQGTEIHSLTTGRHQSLRCHQTTDPQALRLIESVETTHSDRPKQRQLATELGITHPTIPMDSCAKYGIIAQGTAGLYLRIRLPEFSDRKENIWDHAAGAIVLTEAGGQVTDLDGKALNFGLGKKMLGNRGILATNGAIHSLALEKIKALGI